MGPIDALNHLLGFFWPALVVGGVTAALAKLVWRNDLRAASWARLGGWSVAACALASLAGLVIFGRDGMVATYGAMLLASALALMGAGFNEKSRRG